jgi:hypothetical protein
LNREEPTLPAASRSAITMRDLQKISSAEIAALDHAVPIRSGKQIVGMLHPVRRASAADVAAAERASDAFRRSLTDEQRARIDAWLAATDAA